MMTYQYQIIKYVHNQFTGEFVNIGIVVYSPESHFLAVKMIDRTKRITAFFPEADGVGLKKLLKYLGHQYEEKAKELISLFTPPESLSAVTESILARDSTIIQFSEVYTGVDLDFKAALKSLFLDMVDKYNTEIKPTQSLSDEAIWKKKYKGYFDQYKITPRLISHNIVTEYDEFHFDKAWKNEIWHCYEPLSFDSNNKDVIKEKVYKWAGKLQGIQQAGEKMNLTLLSALNENHQDMEDFIQDYLEINNDQLTVDVVFEDEIEEVVQKIAFEMDEHDKHSL